MSVRVFSLTAAAVLAVATVAWAIQGDPIPGADISAEESPGGIRVLSGVSNEAGNVDWRAPTPGTFVISISGPTAVAACRRAIDALPPEERRRIGRGTVLGRSGGPYSRVGTTNGPGVVVDLSNATGGLVAAQWASCDALTTGRPDAKARLTPIILDRAQAAGPLTIGVGYVAGPTTRGG